MRRRAHERTLISAALLGGSVLLAGCSKKEPAPASSGADAPAELSVPPPPEPASGKGERLYVKVTGRTGTDLGKPALVYANRTDRAITSFELRVYFYDAAGQQLRTPQRIAKKPVRPIAPKEIREIETDLGDVPAGAAVEVVVPQIGFADGSSWSDESVAPEVRPRAARPGAAPAPKGS